MEIIVLIGNIIGILNSFILIIYSLLSKKGNKKANLIFALFIFMLTLRVSKSIFLNSSDGLHDLLLTLGLFGFMAIGPTYYFFTKAITDQKFTFQWKQIIHFIPVIIFTFLWIFLDYIRNDRQIWQIFYRAILLQYIIYVTVAIFDVNSKIDSKSPIAKQLNIISIFLLTIWFFYLLNEVAGFPYISGAIIYSVLIYFSIIIIINKGYIINLSNPKYKKTGLKTEENIRLQKALKELLENDKIYKDNTISLSKLVKLLNTNTHALSQVINESYQKTFFELIREYRIAEAKKALADSTEKKISEIAFDVGYNSLSAFNTAFKNLTGLTPTQFRNER